MDSTNKIEIKLKNGETLTSEGSCTNYEGKINLRDELDWISLQTIRELTRNIKSTKDIESISIIIEFDKA